MAPKRGGRGRGAASAAAVGGDLQKVSTRCLTIAASYDPREVTLTYLKPRALCVASVVCTDLRDDAYRLLEELYLSRASVCPQLARLMFCLTGHTTVSVFYHQQDTYFHQGVSSCITINVSSENPGLSGLTLQLSVVRHTTHGDEFPAFDKVFWKVRGETRRRKTLEVESTTLDLSDCAPQPTAFGHALLADFNSPATTKHDAGRLALRSFESVTSIGHGFLINTGFTSIELNGLHNVERCRMNFLRGTKYLDHVDLHHMTALRSCEGCFLHDCGATRVDLSGLGNLESVGDDFLSLTSAASLDLSSFTSLTNCGKSFLASSALRTLAVSLPRLSGCPDNFLAYTPNIESVDLRSLTAVTVVGNDFLFDSGLKKIDLSGFINVQKCGYRFLGATKNLETVNLKSLTALSMCGDGFLAKSGVANVDLSGLRALTTLAKDFLAETFRLVSADLSALTSVRYEDGTQMLRCMMVRSYLGNCGNGLLRKSGIKSVDLCGLASLRVINVDFLAETTQLESVNLSALTGATRICDGFLAGSGISACNTSGLRNVELIGARFLFSTKNLQTIDLSSLTACECCGDDFLAKSGVTSVGLSGLKNLSHCGKRFLGWTSASKNVDLTAIPCFAKKATKKK